jgi:thiamine pyrophosphate-dependent acetolactate synthase large subunit-like protein
MQLTEALEVLAARRTDEVVIATMSAGIHWPLLSKTDRDLAYYAPMGSAGAVGLGLALARPDVRVIVIDGDGSLLMNLGVLVTIGAWKPPNLVHLVSNNRKYDVTGGQPIPGVDSMRLTDLAAAAGIPSVHHTSAVEDWASLLDEVLDRQECTFVAMAVDSHYDREAIPGLITHPAARARHSHAGFHATRASLG